MFWSLPSPVPFPSVILSLRRILAPVSFGSSCWVCSLFFSLCTSVPSGCFFSQPNVYRHFLCLAIASSASLTGCLQSEPVPIYLFILPVCFLRYVSSSKHQWVSHGCQGKLHSPSEPDLFCNIFALWATSLSCNISSLLPDFLFTVCYLLIHLKLNFLPNFAVGILVRKTKQLRPWSIHCNGRVRW